jgi:hypothetical protein
MRNLFIFILSLILLPNEFVLACELSDKTETTTYFKYDDVTYYYFGFGRHLPPMRAAEFEKVLSSGLNVDDFSKEVDRLAALNKETFDDQEVVLARVKKLIVDKKVKWVGIEEGPAEFHNYHYKVIENIKDLQNQLTGAGVDRKATREFLILYFGPVRYLRATEPELFENVSVIPIEDDKLLSRSRFLGQQMDNQLELVLDLDTISGMGIADYQALRTLQDKTEAESRAPNKTEIAEFTARVKRKRTQKPVEQFFKSAASFHAISNLRDLAAARNILRQSESGVVTMGGAHERGVGDDLLNLCKGFKEPPFEPEKSSTTTTKRRKAITNKKK